MRTLIPLLLIGLFCTQPAASRAHSAWEDDGFTVQYSHHPHFLQLADFQNTTSHSYGVTETTPDDVPPGLVWASRFVNGFMVSGGIFFVSLIVRQALGI